MYIYIYIYIYLLYLYLYIVDSMGRVAVAGRRATDYFASSV